MITEFPTAAGSKPTALTTGIDGNLWLGYQDQPAVARVEPNGTVTDFPVPSGPIGAIGSGPDGRIWATQFNADKIARVYVGGPEATFSTTAPDFGSVEVGDTDAETVTLTNTGTLDLQVGAVSLTGSPAFTVVSACPAVLQAGATCSLDLQFAPSGAGGETATLNVGDDVLTLSGVGVSTPAPPVPPVVTPPAPVVTPPAFAVALRGVTPAAKTVKLKITCNRACNGTATVRKTGGARLGSEAFRVAAGRTITITVKAKRGSGPATITLDARAADGSRDTDTATRRL